MALQGEPQYKDYTLFQRVIKWIRNAAKLHTRPESHLS